MLSPPNFRQFQVEEETAILEARRRYQRLRRKHGRVLVDHLFPEAQHVVRRWFEQFVRPEEHQERGLRLDGLHRHVLGRVVCDAAYYPMMISLLPIMIDCDPIRDQRRLPLDLVEDARERVLSEVTDGYVPTDGFDPFLGRLNHTPPPYERPGTQEWALG